MTAGAAALVGALVLSGCAAPGTETETETEVAAGTAPAQLSPVPESVPPLEVTDQQQLGQRTTRYYVATDLVPRDQITGERPSVVVTLPIDYDPALDYPVLYLLHGTDDSAVTWFEKGGVEAATAELAAIVVQPEGGRSGWYTDWSVQAGQSRYWRSHHLDQVVPWVDERFGTVAQPGGRAVAGTSAGGYGAISYAEQRPETFGAAVSFSGLLSLGSRQMQSTTRGEFAVATGDGDDVLGDGRETTPSQWEDADPGRHVGRLQGTAVALYRGSGDEYESRIADTAQTFLDRAQQEGLDVASYRYEELFDEDDETPNGSRCTGGHEWSCWSASLQHATPWIKEQIGAPR